MTTTPRKTTGERQRARRTRLNELARSLGYDSWSKLETAALQGDVFMNHYRFDFVVTDMGQEIPLSFVVQAASTDEAAALWDALLSVLPAGRVGGGWYEVQDEPQE